MGLTGFVRRGRYLAWAGIVLASLVLLKARATPQLQAQSATTTGVAFELLGSIGGSVRGLSAKGERIFARIGQRLVVLDVVDASRPRVLGSALTGAGSGLAVVAGHAYLPGDLGIEVFDVTAGMSPVRRAVLPAPGTPGEVPWLDVRADAARSLLFARSDRTVDVINIESPAAPQILSHIDQGESVNLIAIAGSNLVVAAYNGLTIYDTADAGQPATISRASLIGVRGMAALSPDSIAVVSDAGRRIELHLFSIDRGVLAEQSVVALDYALGWWVMERPAGRLWLSDSARQMMAFDVDDLTAPQLVVRVDGDYDLLAPIADLVWTTGPSHTVSAFSVADPLAPTLAGVYDEPAGVFDVQIDANSVISLGGFTRADDRWNYDVTVVDATDPRSLKWVGSRGLSMPRRLDLPWDGLSTGPFLAAWNGLASIVWGWHLYEPSHLELVNTRDPALRRQPHHRRKWIGAATARDWRLLGQGRCQAWSPRRC